MDTTLTTVEIKWVNIALTDRAPVRIRDHDWPVVACSTGDSFRGPDYSRYNQALARGECHEYSLKVRRHSNGHAIVYGKRDAADDGSDDYLAGELLEPTADVVAAIRRVGEFCKMPDRVIRRCIEGLPAQELVLGGAALANTQMKNRFQHTKGSPGLTVGKRVFVVHGHDESTREMTARFLEKLGLEPIILHEQPSAGRTIIEKMERYEDVAFAVVLLTPDDVGGKQDNALALKRRARQNVILELGYFLGRLGRERVALMRGDVEKPSDYDGVVYILIHGASAWKLILARELRTAGLDVDFNDVM